MGLLSNVTSSITGKVNKALICVKKLSAAELNKDLGGKISSQNLPMAGGALSNVDLRAKLAAARKGFLSDFTSMKKVAETQGYHVMEVKYNPNRIRLYSNSGNQIMSGPGGVGTSMQVQAVTAAATTMQVELLFDDTNIQDAFMMEKFSNITAGSAVTDVAGAVRNARGEGYTVQHQIEGMIALITQSETRQIVFYWGDMAFAGVVTSIDAKYTMFNPLGYPVRGTVNLTIHEGGPDGDGSGGAYWDDAYETMLKGGDIMGKLNSALGNLINLK